MGHSDREVEIKLSVASPAAAARRLRAAGFRVTRRRVFEANEVFDRPDQALREAGTLLRLREAGGQALVTYKGPATLSRHKSREELETGVEDAAKVRLIFARLGYAPVFRYEKYRTEYGDGHGAAMLDETPIGCFLELEGSPAWIDRSARRLGFQPEAYITASYLRLYLEYCREHGKKPDNLTFARPRRRL